jgi:hypothetical protein
MEKIMENGGLTVNNVKKMESGDCAWENIGKVGNLWPKGRGRRLVEQGGMCIERICGATF